MNSKDCPACWTAGTPEGGRAAGIGVSAPQSLSAWQQNYTGLDIFTNITELHRKKSESWGVALSTAPRVPGAAGSGLGVRGFTPSTGVGALRGLPRALQLPSGRLLSVFLQCFIAISRTSFQFLGCDFTVSLNAAPRRPAAHARRAAPRGTCKNLPRAQTPRLGELGLGQQGASSVHTNNEAMLYPCAQKQPGKAPTSCTTGTGL